MSITIPGTANRYSFHPTGAADFSASSNGVLAYQRSKSRSQLAWVDSRGLTIRTIGPSAVNLKLARMSPRLYNDVEQGVNRIWIINALTGTARQAVNGDTFVDNPV